MPTTNPIPLTVVTDDRTYPLSFPVRRVVNAGYVGRDSRAVQAHIDELAREGIPPPSRVPILFPIAADQLTTANRIEVIGRETSGEVEYVLLLDKDEVYVGVGSDHTDRALERQSIVKSKQICKNVISSQAWRYRDVQAHWDELVLQSWVKNSEAEPETLYQKAPLASILAADDLLALVRARLKDGRCDGLVVFSGTIPVVGGHLIHAEFFRAELLDPRLGRSLSCAYRAVRLDYVEGVEE